MAKIIKYKFLSCEIEHEFTVVVPLLDEDGNPVVKEIKTPVTEEVTVPVVEEFTIPVLDDMGNPMMDENGEPIVEVITQPVLDENGEPIMEVVTQPVLDENGEPVYDITYEPVMTEETRVEVEQIILDKSIICPTQAIFDANYPIAEREAIEGTIEVSGEFDTDPVPTGEPVTWDELDAAYTAGYEEGYTEGVNGAYGNG